MTLPRGDNEAAPASGGGDAMSDEDEARTPVGDRSLVEDLEALIDDGRTYLEAEVAYQKTRVAFIADGAKEAIVFVAISSAFAVLTLIGLTVGLIIALSPLLTPWGASGLVVGLLILCTVLSALAAHRRWQKLMDAVDLTPDKDDEA
ncbi:MAG TPA: phage holin family protein [Croceibacterium sp.]|nr:phage holin family protein [Croceibacterium sp.]